MAKQKYFYISKKYEVLYNGNGYTSGDVPVDPLSPYRKGKLVEVLGNGNLAKTGYTFTDWNLLANGSGTSYNPGTTFTISDNVTLYALWSANGDTPYTVNHYKQNLDGSYPSTPTETQNFTGTTGVSIIPAPNYYEGFTSPNGTRVTIAADGSTVVNYQYIRNSYTLTWTTSGDPLTGNYTRGSVKYETPIVSPNTPTKTGYNFSYWSLSGRPTTISTMPAENQEYVAFFSQKTFRVTFYNGGHGTVKVDGRTIQDGEYAFVYYYSNKYLYAYADTGYTFNRWIVTGGVTLSSTTGTTGIRITAQSEGTVTATWNPRTDTPYTVNHYKQNLDDTYNSSPDDTDNLQGTTGASVTPDRKSYAGFTAPNGTTVTIAADGSTVVDYQYTRNSYTITWVTDGDPLTGDYTNGSTKFLTPIVLPNTPTKAGYTFRIWNPVPSTVMPAANSTHTAQWTQNPEVSYTVRHCQQVVDASSTYLLAETENLTAIAGTSVTPAVKTYIGFTSPNTQTVIVAADGSTVITYIYNRNSYTLTWNLDGGTVETAGTSAGSVKYGVSLTAPTVTKTGYDFSSWSPNVPATMPASNSTYTAQWTEKTYAVRFYDNDHGTIKLAGGNIANGGTGTVNHFTTQPLVATPNTGYTFNEWNHSADVVLGNLHHASTTIRATSTGTVTATWTANTYTITYKDQGGSSFTGTHSSGYPTTHTYGTDTTLKSATKSTYTFGGWFTTSDCTGSAVTSLGATDYTANIILYAKWTINSYTITFNSNGGSSVPSITQEVGTSITAPANPTKEGYDFNEWSPAVPATMPAENMTCTAQWTEKTFIVLCFSTKYGKLSIGGIIYGPEENENNGTHKVDATVKYYTTKTLVALPYNGYTFNSWTVTGGAILGNTSNISTTIRATSTGTVTPTYTANTYAITYKDQGGSSFTGTHSSGYPTTHTYGTDTTLKSATKTGYTFNGWFDNSDCTGTTLTILGATDYTANITLYAKWTINSYTITFNSNGGSSVPSITQNYGTSITAPANPTKTGYIFNEWSPALPTTMPAENMTCTAQWIDNNCIITVVESPTGYGTVSGGGTYTYGTSIQISASANTGYDFIKWDDNNTNATRTITVTANKTYTALFEVHKVNIQLKSNSNADDSYVMFNGTKHNADEIIIMSSGETCTLYTLPKYSEWNSLISSERLPFMGFKNTYGNMSSIQKLSNDYICATYTASNNNDNITQIFGTIGTTNACSISGAHPILQSPSLTPVEDSSTSYVWFEYGLLGNTQKGAGYFQSPDNVLVDSDYVIYGSISFYNYSTQKVIDVKSFTSPSLIQTNTVGYGWARNSSIVANITIPENSPYEFVKWKIDRCDPDYRGSAGGGTGWYPLYKDDLGNYGNDYFEKMYGIVFDQESCTIPWIGCHAVITPVLKLKNT